MSSNDQSSGGGHYVSMQSSGKDNSILKSTNQYFH